MCTTLLSLKNKNSSDFFSKVRSCTRLGFFASEFMNICDEFQFLVIRMSSTFYSVSKLKYSNLSSFFHCLIFLSGFISLNPGPNHQHKLQCMNKQNIFKSRDLHFIDLNINSLLPIIEKIIAKSTKFELQLSQLMPQLQVSVNLNQINLLWNLT